MKSLLYKILLSTLLMSNILCTLDIEAAPIAMDLTADLEERILTETENDLAHKSSKTNNFLNLGFLGLVNYYFVRIWKYDDFKPLFKLIK